MRGGGDNEIGGRQGRSLQENYFSNLFFNNIYIFSLNNKTTEILGYLIIFSVNYIFSDASADNCSRSSKVRAINGCQIQIPNFLLLYVLSELDRD